MSKLLAVGLAAALVTGAAVTAAPTAASAQPYGYEHDRGHPYGWRHHPRWRDHYGYRYGPRRYGWRHHDGYYRHHRHRW